MDKTTVLEALRRLNLTAMRYPGGNFASGYHWQDGVGPYDRRPTVRELVWQSIEPDHFSTGEYIQLCRRMGWMPSTRSKPPSNLSSRSRPATAIASPSSAVWMWT